MKSKFVFSVLIALSIISLSSMAFAQTQQKGLFESISDFFAGIFSGNKITGLAVAGCVTPPPSMVGWWSGDGSANDLKFGYISTRLGGVGFSTGLVGQAFNFDGIDDGILILQKDVHSVDMFTMDAWVKPNTETGLQAILTKWEDNFGLNERSYFFGIQNGKLRAVISNDGRFPSADLISTAQITAGQWTHVAATFDGTYLKVYVNGVLDATTPSQSNTLYNADTPLMIGKHPSLNQWLFSGLLDEVEMFSRALSASEIQAIYNAGAAGKCKPFAAVCGNGVIEGEEECDGATISPVDTCAGFGFSRGNIACTNCVLDTSFCSGCLSPTFGLISWWPGDGNTNDIIDANSGALQGGTTFVAGKIGQAFSFDGIDDYISIASNPNQNVNAFTIDAWIYPEDVGSTQLKPIVSKFDDRFDSTIGRYVDKRAYFFGLERGKLRTFISKDGTATLGDATRSGNLYSQSNILLNTWTHVAVTSDGNLLKLYINGVLDAQQKIEFNDIFNADDVPLLIGSYSLGSGPFKGLVDEVELYARALAESEIRTIFQAGSSGKCKGAGVALLLCDNTQTVDLNNADGATVGDTIISANVVAGNVVTVSGAGKGCEMPQSITVS